MAGVFYLAQRNARGCGMHLESSPAQFTSLHCGSCQAHSRTTGERLFLLLLLLLLPPSALWQGPTRGSCQVAWSECRLPAVDSGTPEADRPSLAALHPFKGWHVPLSRICLSLSRSNCVAGLRNPDSEGPVVKL